MDKFKMELTWHNCATCPPTESYNPYLVYTDGQTVEACTYYKKYGFPVFESELQYYWWADLRRTVRGCKEFEEVLHENH